MDRGQVACVRRFNRMVTQRAGALAEEFLGRRRPLGQSRVLWEIGRDGASLRELRARLGLDSGYLSRLVQALEAEGLVDLSPEKSDERVRRARLTRAGRAELVEIDRRSDRAASATLASLSLRQRSELAAAMDTVHRLLRVAGLAIERVEPDSPEAAHCLERYFAELDERFEGGFDAGKSIPADSADLVPPHGAFLVASVDGEPVASGCLRRFAPGTAYLKRMWVDPTLRGSGLGRRMLGALEDQARALGFGLVCLETNRALTEAIALYRSAGYVEVAPFNDEPYAHHWFEKRLG
jgi:DNA-binding MarR family transcriptional regulator/GNAT superfamily N-acetyltransferase